MADGQFTQEQMNIFAENLKRLMKQKGVDQQTVADAIGVSYATMSYYVRAKKYPRLKNMLALQTYFNVDLDDLRNPHVSEFVSKKRKQLYNMVADIPEDKLDRMIDLLRAAEVFDIMGIDYNVGLKNKQ